MNQGILTVLRDDKIDLQAFFDALPLRTREHCRAVARMTACLSDWVADNGLEESPPLRGEELASQAVVLKNLVKRFNLNAELV